MQIKYICLCLYRHVSHAWNLPGNLEPLPKTLEGLHYKNPTLNVVINLNSPARHNSQLWLAFFLSFCAMGRNSAYLGDQQREIVYALVETQVGSWHTGRCSVTLSDFSTGALFHGAALPKTTESLGLFQCRFFMCKVFKFEKNGFTLHPVLQLLSW